MVAGDSVITSVVSFADIEMSCFIGISVFISRQVDGWWGCYYANNVIRMCNQIVINYPLEVHQSVYEP